MSRVNLSADLDRFYSILDILRRRPLQACKLSALDGRSELPARGVYFFFEEGEHRAGDPSTCRVVRVGTHAVARNSKTTLWKRLSNHRGSKKSGGGNHRGSVFRLHVGAALLRSRRENLESWAVGSSAPKEVRNLERDLERDVSNVINQMCLLWLPIDDAPGPDSDRAYVERNAVALLSNALAPIDAPSENWLGRSSPSERIQKSGLWNLNYVLDYYDPRFLDVMERWIVAHGKE